MNTVMLNQCKNFFSKKVYLKNIFSIILLVITCKTYSQAIDYCDYFTLDVSEVEHNGKKVKSYSPAVIENKNEKFQKFLDKHKLRFEYILFRNSESYKRIAEYYPDTNKIRTYYCDSVLSKIQVERYLYSLSPKSIVTWKASKDTFSVRELMEVASKFFYCDAINRKDTSIVSHVCVGINGTKDIQSEKDLTLLEAFSIEAIFKYIDKKKDPLFYTEFIDFKNNATKQNIHRFDDFDSYLIEIRKLCYEEMQDNTDLKNKLLAYYKRNRNNLNFEII